MGLSDREYYREPSPPGFTLSRPQSVVTVLLIANVAIFLLNHGFSQILLNETLSVTPDVITKPWLWWKFITYGFTHDSNMHVLFNMLALWMFGREVEAKYGSSEFLKVFLVAVTLGSIVWCLWHNLNPGPVRYQLLGASGGVTAIVLLFCLSFPRRTVLFMMVFPMPAWVLGIMLVLMDVIQPRSIGMDTAGQVAHGVHLVGAAFAFCYFRFHWNIGRVLPTANWSNLLGSGVSALKKKPKLRIHSPGKPYGNLDHDADRVLQKVHRYGQESLTKDEQRILRDYSRRMQQKHR